MNIQYILFDNDGVLVNTEFWYFEATRKALAELDVKLSREMYMEHMVSGKSSWRYASNKGVSKVAIEKHKAIRNSYYQQYLLSEDIAIKGVEDTLAQLSNNYKMAIVTTSKKDDFELIHQNRNITSHMDFVLSLGDYERTKPAPDPYLKALERFAAKPANAVVIEDSARGLGSALAAKIPCIMIKNNFTKGQDFTGAIAILNSIEELPKYLNANF